MGRNNRKKTGQRVTFVAPEHPVDTRASDSEAPFDPVENIVTPVLTPCRMSAETYTKERAVLIEIEQKSYEQHDKAILTFAAGGLGLSITFLEKIAPHPIPSTLPLIGLAWLSFVVTILGVVGSFLMSQVACRRQRILLDEEYSTGIPPNAVNRPAMWTTFINCISYFVFVFGVSCLAVFSWSNIPTTPTTLSPVIPRQLSGSEKDPMNQKPQTPAHGIQAIPYDKTGAGAVPPSRPVAPQAPVNVDPPKPPDKKK